MYPTRTLAEAWLLAMIMCDCDGVDVHVSTVLLGLLSFTALSWYGELKQELAPLTEVCESTSSWLVAVQMAV